ncbi:hypothetical protein E2C01_009515 [Portunus trituberculatus]|uniref:Uncharacterized protein n=1 Tax=Portunus trituberculatus TaxID=210409 RepID=A0A5B7D5Z9_PORTR|nr:hypothetical protein [Portunus trituberculatus]
MMTATTDASLITQANHEAMASEIENSLTWQCDGDRCSSMLMDCRLSEHGTSLEQSSRFTTF